MHSVPVIPAGDAQTAKAQTTAKRWQLPFLATASSGLVLVQYADHLALEQLDEPKLGAVRVDFASDALTYRRKQSSIKNEAIAKAVGCKGQWLPRVLDATAGLGRDAFVLASLGCQVDMIERSPVVAALLADGLARVAESTELNKLLKMQLFHGVGYDLLAKWQGEKPDVVYLDPMFPHKKKSALVKKEMRLFQQLLGPDDDANLLLQPAIALAKQRVVVKRPNYAPYLAELKPNMSIESKKHRFDVYLNLNKTQSD